MSTEEIAAHLGVPDVAYHASILMGGASPTAAIQTAAMAIAAGVADTFLICMGWNGYSALRPKPDARPTKRTMNLGPMGETVRNLYAPYGLMSAAQHYSLYLRHYVERYGVPEDAAAAVALTCRDHAQLNRKALMRGRPLTRDEYDAAPFIASGNVVLPQDAPWLSDFLSEVAAFPAGAHDDQLDPMFDAINLVQRLPANRTATVKPLPTVNKW